MTYIERITFQVGRYMQIFQYALKEVFRLHVLNRKEDVLFPSSLSEQEIAAKEIEATALLSSYQGKGTEEILKIAQSALLSVKDMKSFRKLLLKRGFISDYFFVYHGSDLGKEDPSIYQSLIDELDSLIGELVELNKSLSRNVDRTLDKLRGR